MKNTKAMAPFRACFKAGAPLISLDTADPAQAVRDCIASLNGKADEYPFMEWDLVSGLRGTNLPGKRPVAGDNAVTTIAGDGGGGMLTNCPEMLRLVAEKAPENSILFMHGMHAIIADSYVAQALWNCRDACKPRRVIVVCLGPSIKLPPCLVQDFMSLTHELPGEGDISEIVDNTLKDADLPLDIISATEKPKVIDTLRGLSAFAVEQVLATSLTKQGVDHDALWARKVRMIEQTPGLSVWRGQDTFEDLGGLDNLKSFLTRVLTSGKTPVRAIGFIDEIEKGLAGSAGDTSGTSQDQLAVFLKVMQDLDVPGLILLGHGGTGKSQIAKAAGSVASAPVIAIDTGAMKGSLVGESEARIRAAMDVFKAVSQGKGLFIATCNKIASLPPELRRRFTLGTFFVDLPSKSEQAKIWQIWRKKFEIPEDQSLPDCEGWTGAEIRACCNVAFRTGFSLRESANYIVPVIRSAPDQVEALRKLAHNRFISAHASGVYCYTDGQPKPVASGRKMEL